MSARTGPILAVEDEESDRIILRLAFERAKLLCLLVILRDGQEVVDYLSGNGPYEDRAAHPRPALIVLDLKMPGMNGFDVLGWLAKQADFKELPAVVLSSSGDEFDRNKARELGARDYFVKPHSLGELIKIAQQMQTCWCAATLPA
jgi:DNA-binding response OmpR family regulator